MSALAAEAPLLLSNQAAPRSPSQERVARDLAFDRLLDGLEAGNYGGTPVTGGVAVALVEVLRRLGWAAEPSSFSNAMPHLPERFDLHELCCVLYRLGYSTRAVEQPGHNLPMLPAGTIVVDRRALRFVGRDADGRDALVDTQTGAVEPVRPRRTYHCYIFEEGADRTADTRRGQSTLSRIHLRFRPELRLLLLLTLMSSALVVVASKSVAFIFDTVRPTGALDTLAAVLVGIAALFAFDLRLRRLKARIIGHVSGRLEFILSSELYEKLTSLPLEMLTTASVSDQLSRLKQFETVRDFFCGPVVTIVLEIPFVMLLLTIVTVLSPPVGLLVAAAIGLYVLTGMFLLPRIRAAAAQLSARKSEYSRLMAETFGQGEQIVRRGLGRACIERLQPCYERCAEAQFAVDRIFHFLNGTASVLAFLTMAGTLFVGAWAAMSGNLTTGALIACVILTTRLLGPVQQALLVAVRVPEILGVFRQIDTMMRLNSQSDDAAIVVPDRKHVRSSRPALRIDGAVLRYPRSAAPALKGVSLNIEHGSFVCIGGPSGAGKSTLLRAITGLYKLQAGGIYLGSANLDQLNGKQRTDLIGYLGHAPFLIHGTVAQNLRLTAPGATMRELEVACDEIGLTRHVEALPDGFDTRLTHAVQAQMTPAFQTKLGIAQLLLKDPAILLLDEPEARLSPDDEKLLMSAIERRRGRTSCLQVTHRPSILKRADQVLMLQSGQTRFAGPPEKLNFERSR